MKTKMTLLTIITLTLIIAFYILVDAERANPGRPPGIFRESPTPVLVLPLPGYPPPPTYVAPPPQPTATQPAAPGYPPPPTYVAPTPTPKMTPTAPFL